MSIHKSQGQTLEGVKVDLARIFEKGAERLRLCVRVGLTSWEGQAYVALSRATSLEGLQVLNFDPVKVRLATKRNDFGGLVSIVHLGKSPSKGGRVEQDAGDDRD